MQRYSIINRKNPREIILLRGKGCAWKRCTFCDYHSDFSLDSKKNFELNSSLLSLVTGIHSSLEVINSGSFTDLDNETMDAIAQTCVAKKIHQLRFESHWLYRNKIKQLKDFYGQHNIEVKIKTGVETFDIDMRDHVLQKGFCKKSPKEIAYYFDECCLLFGLSGQTTESMLKDIEIGLDNFERICINIMQTNTTPVLPDFEVIRAFKDKIFPLVTDNNRVDILLENTAFGVG